MNLFARTELLIGKENLQKLQKAKVAVIGIGGVGGYVVEGLVRAGVGNITIMDHDTIAESNINRQIIATTKNIGKYKVEEMQKRVIEINPAIQIQTINAFYDENSQILDATYDYVVDAIDTVSSKIAIIQKCKQYNLPVISCMGTGNKLQPSQFKITDISNTKVCPLAKVMRKELKKLGIEKVQVLYSEEEPIKKQERGMPPASISFVPSVAGLLICAEVVKEIIKEK